MPRRAVHLLKRAGAFLRPEFANEAIPTPEMPDSPNAPPASRQETPPHFSEAARMNSVHEKALETITLHLPESLKRDLQDLALAEDRAVGEWIRHHLTLIVYGRLQMKEAAKRNGETRK